MRLPSKEAVGLTLFFILLAASLVIVLLGAEELPSGAFRIIRYIVTEMEAFVVASGALAYSTTEGGTMIAEAYLKKRFEAGRREKDAEWRERWRKHEAELRAWYERSQAAKQRGEPFDEPPPFMRSSQDDQP